MRLGNCRIEVGQKLIAEVQIFPADLFDLGVVQCVGVRQSRSSKLPVKFRRLVTAQVPTPGQAQLPRSPMAAKRWTEGAELKPADEELGGELLRRDKATCIRAPVRNAAQPGIDAYAYLRCQRGPGRKRVP